MKLVITAGGGGHFAPALSVLSDLPKDTKVLFIGRKYSIEKDKTVSFEYHMAKELGIPFYPLETGKLQRPLTTQTFRSFLKIPRGLFHAITRLREFQPDVVLSFGGYVSLPVTIAAHILGIPVIIHEQTMEAGLANKIASNFAWIICISWESSKAFFPKEKTVLTGNPIRREMIDVEKKHTTLPEITHMRKPLIYVTGGSLGSHRINELMKDAMAELSLRYCIIHQTGDAGEFNDFAQLEKVKQTLPDPGSYVIKKFLKPEEVATVFHHASLIIGRSGANTMMEILYFGKPAILIPIHVGQKNEQETNAKFLKKIGLAEILHEDAKASDLIQLIDEIFARIDKYDEAALEAKKYVPKDSSKRIIHEVSKVVSKKTES